MPGQAGRSVEGSVLREFVRALGFDPTDVVAMHVDPTAIAVTTVVRDADGRVRLDPSGTGTATLVHRVEVIG